MHSCVFWISIHTSTSNSCFLFSFSDKYTRFCQWKNLELNIQVSWLKGFLLIKNQQLPIKISCTPYPKFSWIFFSETICTLFFSFTILMWLRGNNCRKVITVEDRTCCSLETFNFFLLKAETDVEVNGF